MIKLKKINNEVIVPIPNKVPKLDKIKGSELFPEIYSNIFICARKKRGKTNCIFKILKNCTNSKTKLVFFASTIHKDYNLKHIIEYFKKKGNPIEKYTCIKEEKVDILKRILDELGETEEETEKPKLQIRFMSVDSDGDDIPPPKKQKKLAPEIIFIFDDCGEEANIKSVTQLLKTNRHYNSKVIISTQYPHDISVSGRKMIDYCLLFSGHSDDKLQIIYNNFSMNIPYELFIQLYQNATMNKHSFLYIDINNVEFRKNFDMEYDITEFQK